jgi:hypothetical protein
MHKTPYPFLPLPRGPSPGLNSTRGKEKGGAAYRRRERSGEGRGRLREVLAVSTVYGSTAEVARIVRSTCAGGWSRRRRVFRLNHGDLVQSNGTMSFTGWRRGYVHKESKNGAKDYPVYIRRRSGEVQRPWTGFSGEAKSDSLLRELHRDVHSLFQGSCVAEKGSVGRSTVAGARVAAGTPCTGQTPVVSGSGEVELARRKTVNAWGWFIGAGASRRCGRGLAWRRSRGVGHGRALARAERVEHVEVFFCPCSKACWDRIRANLGKNPAQTSSWHLWLSLICEFQGRISPRSEDMRTPNLACLPAHFATKVMPSHVKRQGLGLNFFQGVP